MVSFFIGLRCVFKKVILGWKSTYIYMGWSLGVFPHIDAFVKNLTAPVFQKYLGEQIFLLGKPILKKLLSRCCRYDRQSGNVFMTFRNTPLDGWQNAL